MSKKLPLHHVAHSSITVKKVEKGKEKVFPLSCEVNDADKWLTELLGRAGNWRILPRLSDMPTDYCVTPVADKAHTHTPLSTQTRASNRSKRSLPYSTEKATPVPKAARQNLRSGKKDICYTVPSSSSSSSSSPTSPSPPVSRGAAAGKKGNKVSTSMETGSNDVQLHSLLNMLVSKVDKLADTSNKVQQELQQMKSLKQQVTVLSLTYP